MLAAVEVTPPPRVEVVELTAPPREAVETPVRKNPIKRIFSVDEFLPYWVYEGDLMVAIWYLRLPTSTNLVTSSDYCVTVNWTIPVPSNQVFSLSHLPQSVYYRELSAKEGSFRIYTQGQIQQDQGKWRKEIHDCWIYIQIPKITSIEEKEFAF
jgi:hypothetical protein